LDPEEEIVMRARHFVVAYMQRSPAEIRLTNFEMTLPRLLHLIALHPDFSMELESLKDTSDYLDLYFDIILTADNIHLLTFLAQKVKSVRVESHTKSENLYAVSELAQHKIRTRALRHSWSTNAYPGKISMPSDIFRALPSSDVAAKIQKTVYLPEEKIEWLDQQSKLTHVKPVAKTRTGTITGTRKRKSPNVKARRRTKRRKKAAEEDSSSEVDLDSDGEDSEDPIEEDTELPSSPPAKTDDPDEGMHSDDVPTKDTKLGRGAPRKAKTLAAQTTKRRSGK